MEATERAGLAPPAAHVEGAGLGPVGIISHRTPRPPQSSAMRHLVQRTVPLFASALLLVGCGGDERTTRERAGGERSLETTARAAVALMKSGEAGAADAVLPALEDLEAVMKGSLARLPAAQREREEKQAKEQGGASGTRETMRTRVIRRARAARESAGKDLDWSLAEFDRVDEPASRKPLMPDLPEEVASVTFYVKAGGAAYRFRAKEAMRFAGGWNFSEGWRYEGPDSPHDTRIETWEADARTFREGTRKALGRARQLVQDLGTQQGEAAPTAESVMAVLREILAIAPRPGQVGSLITETGAALDSRRLNPEDSERVERLRSDAQTLQFELDSVATELWGLRQSVRLEALCKSLEQQVRADLASSDEATRSEALRLAYWLRVDTSAAAAR